MMWRLARCTALLCAAACTDDGVDIPPAGPAPGHLRVLDAAGAHGETGWWPALAIDASNRPHLTYCDAWNGDLRYATRGATGWKTVIAVGKGAVGKYTAVGVKRDGGVGIAYYDQDAKYFSYAFRGPGETAWKTERVAWGLEVGMAAVLLFDDTGRPHLIYYVPSGRLIHAVRDDAQWHKETLAEATGGFSVRIDAALREGTLWVSYVDWNMKYTTVYLAHKSIKDPQARWHIEQVDDERSPGWRSQMVWGQGGAAGDKPQILYSESLDQHLKIAAFGPEGWQSRVLLTHASNFAARAAADGEVTVAYEDVTHGAPGNGTIKYMRGRGTSWTRYAVDPDGPAGRYLALALDSDGRPVLAYFAGDIRGIKIYEEGATTAAATP